MTLYVMPTMPVNFLLELTNKFELKIKVEKLPYLYARVVMNSAIKHPGSYYICLDEELFTIFTKELELTSCKNTAIRDIKIPDMVNDQFILLYLHSKEEKISICRVSFIKD